MIKGLCRHFLVCVISLLTLPAFAANLAEVYQDACASDPAFKAAQAEFQAIKQAIPLSVANFLPQISLIGSLSRAHTDQELSNQGGIIVSRGLTNLDLYNNTTTYTLSATQSLFNVANWAILSTADAQVKQAAANLCAAAQDLMIRTSAAYFAVLRASEDLRFTQAEKRAIKHELDQNKDRYQVGLIAITAVYEAQARFDDVIAREIFNKNQYSNRIEELRQITGKSYRSLLGIGNKLPLVTPRPTQIDAWVKKSEQQNYTLQAARYGSQAARENIKLQFAGHLPIVNAQGNYSYNFQDNYIGSGESKSKIASVAVEGTLPITNGGGVIAATRQARYQYQQAIAVEEQTHRSIIAQARNNYLGVLSAISQINADNQAIISSQSALDATQASYEVGTRTMVDVLNSQSNLYNIQRVSVAAQYNYLLQTLLLKQTAGTLSPEDIVAINRCLKKLTTMITDKEIMHTEIPAHSIPEQIAIQGTGKTAAKITSFPAKK
jgi:outer membrane protein